ncbi:MAG: ATP-binding protein [Verrucomicrobiales bacterium]
MIAWVVFVITLLVCAFFVHRWLWRPLFSVRRYLEGLFQPARDESACDFVDFEDLAAQEIPLMQRTPFWPSMISQLQLLGESVQELKKQVGDDHLNLQAILSHMAEGVIIVDQACRVRLANEGVHRMFALRETPMNRSLMELFRNRELQLAAMSALNEAAAFQKEISQDIRSEEGYVKKYFQVTTTPLKPNPTEGPIAVLLVFHEITRLKELENIRKDFVANVSHELRTPLAIINGYLETLLDGALDEPELVEGFLKTMRKHGQRLTHLVDDLLTLSQLENRGLYMDLSWVSLQRLIEQILEQLHPKIEARGAQVRLSFREDVPRIFADAIRLEQMVFNLVDNALKYGGIKPDVEIAMQQVDDSVVLSVRDGGDGIPYSDQGHIFERFYRVHKDRSRDGGGTGLGLSIVKHTAQVHGGSVSVDSQPGQGARFSVTLPISGPSDAEPVTLVRNSKTQTLQQRLDTARVPLVPVPTTNQERISG